MTYSKMEKYIRLFENSDEILETFQLVKEVAKLQSNKRGFVYRWFVAQFPNYDEIPEIRNGKLYTPVIGVPEAEEKLVRLAA